VAARREPRQGRRRPLAKRPRPSRRTSPGTCGGATPSDGLEPLGSPDLGCAASRAPSFLLWNAGGKPPPALSPLAAFLSAICQTKFGRLRQVPKRTCRPNFYSSIRRVTVLLPPGTTIAL